MDLQVRLRVQLALASHHDKIAHVAFCNRHQRLDDIPGTLA